MDWSYDEDVFIIVSDGMMIAVLKAVVIHVLKDKKKIRCMTDGQWVEVDPTHVFKVADDAREYVEQNMLGAMFGADEDEDEE